MFGELKKNVVILSIASFVPRFFFAIEKGHVYLREQ